MCFFGEIWREFGKWKDCLKRFLINFFKKRDVFKKGFEKWVFTEIALVESPNFILLNLVKCGINWAKNNT